MTDWWEQQDQDDRWVQQMLEDEKRQQIDEEERKQIAHLREEFDKIFGGKDV